MVRPVDGYVEIPKPDCSLERRIFQFHGDYFHQCPRHFPGTADSKENRYERTQCRTSIFRTAGYTAIQKSECEFRDELRSNPEVKAHFEIHSTSRVAHLERTSALWYHHKADLSKGEQIKMADVVSEYRNANLRGKYPYGHPTFFLEGDPGLSPVNDKNGAIKCTVLPSRNPTIRVMNSSPMTIWKT